MRIGLAGLILAGFLIGCGQANMHAPPQGQAAQGGVSGEVASDPPAPPPASPDAASSTDAATSDGRAAQPTGAHPNQPAPDNITYLAYAYQTTLELPANRITGVMDGHVKACQDAGPRFCQLVGSSRSGDPDSEINGEVSLRAEPNWLRTFMAHLGHDADAAGGRIFSQATVTEDLTRNIIDTQASLNAQKALRDRLQDLLSHRPGRLSDLLDVERELARVQAEIDATQSNLAVMRTRVDMSALTLTYQSSAKAVRSDTIRPLGEALASFLGIVVQGLAWIVTLIAVLIPFALVIGPVVWLMLHLRARRKKREAADAAAP